MKIYSFRDLDVYKKARAVAKRIKDITDDFPKVEMFALTDQIRRSSRSVCAQIAEGWGRRMYRAAFIDKLSQAEGEARETQSWLDQALDCEYITQETHAELDIEYNNIIGKLVTMINNPGKWVLTPRK